MFGIENKVEKAARKGAAFSAAALLGGVGAAFLTAAGWMILSELRSELFAASVIGVLYLGAAAISAAWGMKNPSNTASSREQLAQGPDGTDLSPLQLVAVSFIQGFEQGRRKDRVT